MSHNVSPCWSSAPPAASGVTSSRRAVAAHGQAQPDLDAAFARLDADLPGSLDAVHDLPNMALQEEPERVRHDLDAVRARHSRGEKQ